MRTNERSVGGERKWWMTGAAIVTAGGLAISGCTTSNERAGATNSRAPAESTQSSPTSTTEPLDVQLVFDDLDGGSPIIQVYPGVSDSVADKLATGTYRDGQTVYAECKTKGRKVSSHPELGEAPRTSDDWIRFHSIPDIGPYATAVYVENPEALLAQLPDC